MSENTEKHDLKLHEMNRDKLIQAYVLNKLGKEEREEFDQLYKNDAAFRKEVEFHQDMAAAFSEIERKRIKTKLQKFEEELKAPKPKSYTPWLVAASVLIIVGIGLMNLFDTDGNSDQLYMAYFEPYENVVQPITRGQSIENLKTTVFIAYEKQEYTKAAEGFHQLYESTDETYFLLYEANALMADNQLEKAIPILEKHVAMEDEFVEKSRWYLALAYLKTEKVSQAEKLLQEIKKRNSYKAKDASAILQKL